MDIKNKIKEIDLAISQNNFNLALKKINILQRKKINNVDLLIRQTRIYYMQNDFEVALSIIEKINTLIPEDKNLKLLNLDIALKAKNIIKSKELISDLEHRVPDQELIGFKIQFYKLSNQYKKAITCLKKEIGDDSKKNRDIFFEIGFLLNANKDYDESLSYYNKALQQDNKMYSAFYNKGITLANIMRFDEAIDAFNSALKIDSSQQLLYQELAGQYESKNDLVMAEKVLNQAINKFEDNANLKCIKAFLCILKKDINQAINIYNEVIQDHPNFYRSYCDKAYLLLAQGNFIEGWEYYQYRQLFSEKCLVDDRAIKNFDNISSNKIIDILPEQGIGDYIFHARLLQKMQKIQKSNCINFYTDSRLIKILKDNFEKINFIDLKEYKKNPKNIELNLASLARFFVKTKKDIFFDKLHVKKLEIKTNVIGISWFSGNSDWGVDKSIPLELFSNLDLSSNVRMYSLQYGDVDADVSNFNRLYPGKKIINDPSVDKFKDIYQLCQIIQECEYVITVSNITAHLAGALGKKCYLLLPRHLGKMWYWLSEKGKSIWYPSIIVIPQEVNETWEDSICKLNKLIQK